MSERIAYSYRRYSSPQQGDGDSIGRQTRLAAAWCKAHGCTLDTSTTIEDRGRSAFRGKHRETGNLASFLAEVEAGRIPRGSILIIENMDRLSREPPVRAVNVLSGILLAGIRVVQLAPDELELTEDSDLFSLLRGQLAQARGHDESKRKSGTVGEAWGERKARARDGGEPVTARCPAWLEVVGQVRVGKHVSGGSYRELPERVEVVKRIFELACRGEGLSLIVKRLTKERVRPISGPRTRKNKESGKTETYQPGWSKAYVYKILTGRAVLGEYQPRRGTAAQGPIIAGYYPVVVDPEVWERAQNALAARRDRKPGRPGKSPPALFSGLLWDARTQGRVVVAWQTRGHPGKRGKRRVLVSAGSMEGRGATVSFPNEIFEAAILSMLREVNVADVLGAGGGGEATKLTGELGALEARIRAVEAELTGDEGDAPALARALASLDARRLSLVRQLAEARRQEDNPAGAALAEAQSLLAVSQTVAGRLRLRALFAAAIERVTLLVVPRASRRLCAARVDFPGGTHRDYLVYYAAAGYCREGRWWARSLASVAQPGDLDLRDPSHAQRLEKVLATLDM